MEAAGAVRHAPIIVAATFGEEDFAYLDGLRRAHFPPTRNQLSAHLTLFHHLPPSVEGELKTRLAQAGHGPAPRAQLSSVMNLGRGVALRVVSPDLDAIRHELVSVFSGVLTPQDAGGWRPRVTIQNKALPFDVHDLMQHMTATFRQRPLTIRGLAAYHYLGGPWQLLGRYPFRGQP